MRKIAMGITAAGVFGALLVFAASEFTGEMLETDASRRARDWSANLVSNVSDLPNIPAGQLPSDESIVFFEQAKVVGDVWQYRIYDAKGKLVIVSDRIGRTHKFTETLQDKGPAIFARLAAGSSGGCQFNIQQDSDCMRRLIILPSGPQ